ncbi:MAG TPA: DUF1800 domain-containing protein [Casimicrobiaceae bacterium]|nr:DUF1800 domain-containing protein [Casimicrobiaceae bacterium]
MPARRLAALAWTLAVAALASHAPALAASAALGYDDARHLLARTGFGPTDTEIRAYAAMTREAAVDSLLRGAQTVATLAPPASAADTGPLRPPRGDATAEERKVFVRTQVREGLELRGWWISEMRVTPSPLTERMTLFWHNHFVSAQPKVRTTRLMYWQNATLRANALGNFGTLLHAMAKDPAMLVYLDGVRSRKGTPNENFAREVMELFTLGEGHYSETDVKEAARAFTGWSLDRETGHYVFRPALHDYGMKTVLGKSGRFDGDDVLDILLARPETAEYVTAKLWREFVAPDVDAADVRRIAAQFRESHYDIRVALKEILTSDAFYAAEHRGVLVKSPVELVVGTLRVLQLQPGQPLPFAVAAAGMGQNLFSAPNVKGWPGGEAWINTTTLLARKQFVDRVMRGRDAMSMTAVSAARSEARVADAMDGEPSPSTPMKLVAAGGVVDADAAQRQRFLERMERGASNLHFDAARWLGALPGATAAERGKQAQRLLLAVAPQQAVDFAADPPTVVHALVLDAAYQLK